MSRSGKESIGIDLRGNSKSCIIYHFEAPCIKLLVLEMAEMNNDGKAWLPNHENKLKRYLQVLRATKSMKYNISNKFALYCKMIF